MTVEIHDRRGDFIFVIVPIYRTRQEKQGKVFFEPDFFQIEMLIDKRPIMLLKKLLVICRQPIQRYISYAMQKVCLSEEQKNI